MRNEGLGRIKFRDREQLLVFVDALSADAWSPDVNVFWDETKPAMTTPLFERHAWVDPNETIKDELLIPAPHASDASPPIAYRVHVWIRAPRRWGRNGTTWTANTVVPCALSDGPTHDLTSVAGKRDVT